MYLTTTFQQQSFKLLYQFARGDNCYQNTDHRYIMQLTREICGFNYSPMRRAYKSSFENLEDKLNTEGKNEEKSEYSNSEIVFEYSNGMQISKYSLTSLVYILSRQHRSTVHVCPYFLRYSFFL